MNDTSPDAEAHLRAILDKKSPAERLQMGCSMFSFSRTLVTSAILREHPDISSIELRERLFRIYYGQDFKPDELERIVEHLREQSSLTQHDVSR